MTAHSDLQASDCIEIAPAFRFRWEESQGAYVLLYPEGVVKLNESAGEILKRCTGERSVTQIITDLQQQFPDADLEASVRRFLEVSHDNGWIRVKA